VKTVRRLLYADVVNAVVFVAAAFLSLFYFIDFVEELGRVSKTYSALSAALYALLEMPGHLYELAPIAVLIGTIYALSRLAQSSEFTILRTGGLGPGRALSLLMGLGLAFGVFTFVLGDYVAPWTEQTAARVRAVGKGGLGLGSAGAWLKDRQTSPLGERFYTIHVRGALSNGELRQIKIFEFDATHTELRRILAHSARVGTDGVWVLRDVVLTDWPQPASAPAIQTQNLSELRWSSSLPAGVVAAAVLPEGSLSTLDLWRYIDHLDHNEQAAQRYEITFWKRALYPLACLVMVALALPFAYLHSRSGGISLKVFGGIMLGISFVLLNNVASHLGLLKQWTPWLVAATPSLLYLGLSLAAFSWLVRYR
jgi:lipopolysaccharide export system permease protein